MRTVEFDIIPLRSGMRVLDAGCGGGRHLFEAFLVPGVTVVGIDLKWDDLCNAKKYLSSMPRGNNGRWVVARADLNKIPFENETFDIVVCSEVLEHIQDNRTVVSELVRVLKPGGDFVVTVPRYLPERICWAISREYHMEPGGHVRIYTRTEILKLVESFGLYCRRTRYRHGLHAPYWWLKCVVGHKNDAFPLVRTYRKFLEWNMIKNHKMISMIERILDPIIGKSIIFYFKKA